MRERLGDLFKPETVWCYQKVQALPAVDEIDIAQDKTVLFVANPHPCGLHPDLRTLYDNIDFKNRVCFLTRQRSADSLLNAAKELKAIRHIIDELKSEGTPDNDPELVQARDLLDRIQNQFGSALRETFSTLYYPSAQSLMSADFPMEFTANRYDGEDQIIRTLRGKLKYTEEVTATPSSGTSKRASLPKRRCPGTRSNAVRPPTRPGSGIVRTHWRSSKPTACIKTLGARTGAIWRGGHSLSPPPRSSSKSCPATTSRAG
ncbi:hypothetical protein [Thiocapsa sp.]|uniref:hypothetical protein n=1 Tax=Thiocapsa sp. TaxID=2024551 RepID=UPI0035930E41